MLQWLLEAPGRISLLDRELPRPSRGEVLVKVRAALTCGTDLKAYVRGHPAIPMPGPFGHEFSGTVEAVGAGVKSVKPGDDVMAVHSAPCLKCSACRKGLHNLCSTIMQTKVLGAYAEYVLLPPHVVKQNIFKKPRGLSFEEAAMLEPLSCVVHANEPLRAGRGNTALVIGGGPIGLMHLMLLKLQKARVALSDRHKGKLRLASKLGADETVRPAGIKGALKKLTGGEGFDFVIECTGRKAVWESAADFVRPGGTVVLFGGAPSGTMTCFDTNRLHYDEITLKGSFHFTPEDVKRAFNHLIKSGRLRTDELVSGTYPLKKLETALKKLKRGIGIKYAIVP